MYFGDARAEEHYQDARGNVFARCPQGWCFVGRVARVPQGMLGACFGDLEDASSFSGSSAESVLDAIGRNVSGVIKTTGEAKAGKSVTSDAVKLGAIIVGGVVAAKLLNIF